MGCSSNSNSVQTKENLKKNQKTETLCSELPGSELYDEEEKNDILNKLKKVKI